MKLKYKSINITLELLLGIAWIVLSIIKLNSDEGRFVFSYIFMILGIAWVMLALYRLTFHYGTIKDGVLKKNIPFSPQLKLEEVTVLHKSNKEYFLETIEGKEYPIKISKIDKQSKIELDKVLSALQIEVKSH